MRIVTTTVLGLALAGIAFSLSASLIAGQRGSTSTMGTHQMAMAPKKMMTQEQKIANAMSAAPSGVTAKATILDWPAKEGDAPQVLRAGTNGWTCMPDMPDSEGNDPACLDKSWMRWIDAYMAHKAPQITDAGIGYMIAPGGGWGSNTDPYAMSKTADNQWHLAPPHLMILVPDLTSLSGMSTDSNNGGPYVMYAGTPYAHIMAPITTAAMKTMPSR